ncbi:hypothetical protein F4604DRAFT_14714 [Suillus subluteus]|nr:hypothetical protein F4604DRAFT_14714 [Suillus subluteus]
MIDPPTLMSNFMMLALTIIQSMLAVPESMIDALLYDAIKEGRWNEAWERMLKALASFDEPYLDAAYSEHVNHDTECTSKDASITQTCMPVSDHREFTVVSAPHVNFNASGIQNQNASILPDASCASASPSDVDERLAFLSSPETSTIFQPLSRTNVMTGGPEAKPIESVPEQLFVDSHTVREENSEDSETVDSHPFVCSCFICEEDRENDALLDFRLDGRNIVLDSLYPDIAPHIVITPPVSYPDDFYTPHQNRVDPQWPCFLNVPCLSPHMFYHYCPLSSSHDESADCHSNEFHSQSVASSDDLGVIRPRTPPRVFSHEKLLLAVEASSIERLVFRDIVDGIFRHRRKAAAFEASLSASAVCARFNESVAASQLEQPFVWTDPAQPILLACRKFSGVSIIESDCPFRAPHIVIIAAEPHDPWISWSNRVDDQDYEYLTVYPKRSSTPPINSTSLTTASVPGLHHQGDPDDDSFIPSHSDHSRERHLTGLPPSLDESGCFLTLHEKGRMTYTDHSHSTPDVNEFMDSETMSRGLSITRCETPTPDSDDEDDLPPFDDWYLSVIERSKALGA